MFFFEKKNQKTFVPWRTPCGNARAKLSEVFWFFFSKKNCFLLSLVGTAPAAAATVDVTILHVRNTRGHVLVALCAKADFLKPHCPWQASAPAAAGTVRVTLTGVPSGRYAIEAYHDENDNRVLDRNFLGLPTEGMAFSNDAPLHFGPPSFDAAAIDVGGDVMRTAMTMRYY